MSTGEPQQHNENNDPAEVPPQTEKETCSSGNIESTVRHKSHSESTGNEDKGQVVTPGVGEHPLQYNYTFWYSRRTPSRPASTTNYEQNIKQFGTVASVEQFWKVYSHLVRPGDLTGYSDFHLFKEGIKPMWEDEANRNGGKWIIRLRKGLASRFWENIILAMLGEQFMVGEEICGVVVSIRFQEDILSIWNKTANDQITTARIRDTLRRVLNLPPNTIMEYKTHNDSLKGPGKPHITSIFPSSEITPASATQRLPSRKINLFRPPSRVPDLDSRLSKPPRDLGGDTKWKMNHPVGSWS